MAGNVYSQFQQSVEGVANSMLTQLVCQEKGISYSGLLQAAQQTHLQQIIQAEQMKQVEKMVNRHYNGGGTGLFGKIKEVFAPEQSTGMFGMGMMGANPMMVQQPMNPQSLASMLIQQPAMPQVPAIPESPQAIPFEDNRVDTMEKDIADMKQMILNLANAMTPAP
jgi:hypothetical protein